MILDRFEPHCGKIHIFVYTNVNVYTRSTAHAHGNRLFLLLLFWFALSLCVYTSCLKSLIFVSCDRVFRFFSHFFRTWMNKCKKRNAHTLNDQKRTKNEFRVQITWANCKTAFFGGNWECYVWSSVALFRFILRCVALLCYGWPTLKIKKFHNNPFELVVDL